MWQKINFKKANLQDTGIEGKSLWKETFKRLKRDKVAMFGAALIIILVFIAIMADFISPCKPEKQFYNGTTAYGMPLPMNSFSKKVEIIRNPGFSMDSIVIPINTMFVTLDNKNSFKVSIDVLIKPSDMDIYIPVSPLFTETTQVKEGTPLKLEEATIEGISSFTLKNDKYFPLGTDSNGRDILSRLFHGSRVSLEVGMIAVGIALIIGVVLGLVSGYFGGWVDIIIMRITDIMMSFPDLLLVMAIVGIIGPSFEIIFFAIGVVMWTGIARIVRGQVFSVREMEYVEASKACGASNSLIIFKHVFPNVIAPVIVIATMDIAGAIMTEAALSFLGFGVKPPTASWGGMINDGLSYFRDAPWLPLLPGIFIAMTVFSFNLFGDGLRDALDPKLK